jgi:hypothetical protein
MNVKFTQYDNASELFEVVLKKARLIMKSVEK